MRMSNTDAPNVPGHHLLSSNINSLAEIKSPNTFYRLRETVAACISGPRSSAHTTFSRLHWGKQCANVFFNLNFVFIRREHVQRVKCIAAKAFIFKLE